MQSAEELLEVYKLRSEIYDDIGFKEECPDLVYGYNFDNFDTNAAIIRYKNNGETTGTTRLIFDTPKKLPTDTKYSFDKLRMQFHNMVELSRLGVKSNNNASLSQEFKYLLSGVHNVCVNQDIDVVVSGLKYEHYLFYKKFGGITLIKELGDYGKIPGRFFIMTWEPEKCNNFFRKLILGESLNIINSTKN